MSSNTVVRKLGIKLEGRLAVGVLPLRRPVMRQRGMSFCQHDKYLVALTTLVITARALQPAGERQDENQDVDINSDDIDIPEDVEAAISVLFEGLQDKVGFTSC